jgi:hypothetical protein
MAMNNQQILTTRRPPDEALKLRDRCQPLAVMLNMLIPSGGEQ